MPRDNELPSEQEMNETIERNAEQMREQGEELEKAEKDVGIAREIVSKLELRSSREGVDRLKEGIEETERVSEHVFDREDDKLENFQSETEDHKEDLEERDDATERDLGTLSDESASLEKEETIREFGVLKGEALRAIDTLDKMIEREKAELEDSQEIKREYEARVREGKHK